MPEKTSQSRIPIFVQTAFPEQPKLDQWKQITEEEAKVAYDVSFRTQIFTRGRDNKHIKS